MKPAHRGAILIGLMAASAIALAAQSVTFNGLTYTCTNQCVITTSGGSYTITDSQGGIVNVTIPGNHEK